MFTIYTIVSIKITINAPYFFTVIVIKLFASKNRAESAMVRLNDAISQQDIFCRSYPSETGRGKEKDKEINGQWMRKLKA